MEGADLPRVSVLTPVYNGAEHLAECIESVLAQTYSNWDYTIVNNVSTDGSLAIAQKYAAIEPRIRIVNNDRFLPIISNHNHTIRHLSPESKYCKFVFCDDWLYPTCIEAMVRLAEENPSVGLVGSYTMDGRAVLWPAPPFPCRRISGRAVCRTKLLGGDYVFGSMTSLLVRSDLIRKRTPFFNEQNLHADFEACYDILRECDFGFVHQVLNFSRPRAQSVGSFAKAFDSIILGEFVMFLKYGPDFLDGKEYGMRLRNVRRQYYQVLATDVLHLRAREFWRYHAATLEAFGASIDLKLLAASVMVELGKRMLHPVKTSRAAWRWWCDPRRRTSYPQELVRVKRGEEC
jgi:glycosyltransferase involved in cell wall biosynthesis